FYLLIRPPPPSPSLFPYTTLFRSDTCYRSKDWHERTSRNKYDATVGGKLLVLLTIYRPSYENALADKSLLDKWLPTDMYIGGAEHAVLHLLYARFWHKFLYDIGAVSTKETLYKLINEGIIIGSNNEKMSKSKGNVINPDEIVTSHGADTLRLYEMFMGPLDADVAWSTTGLDGAK